MTTKLHWAIRLRKKLLINGSWKWNAWVRDFTAFLETKFILVAIILFSSCYPSQSKFMTGYHTTGYIKNDSVLMRWIGPIKKANQHPDKWVYMYDVYSER